jgi:hypothetical protein
MSLRYSTGYRNGLLQGGSFRELFENGVIRMFTGSQPSSADTAATGTLLVTITRAGAAFSVSALSGRQTAAIKVTIGTATETYTITINGYNYTYTMQGGDDVAAIAKGLAALVRKSSLVNAQPWTNAGLSGVMVEAKVAGESYSCEVSATASIGSLVVSTCWANSRLNGLVFGSASAGVIGKESAYAWSGSAVVTGTAGWFRLSDNDDDYDADSTIACRIDGSVGTSGADLIVGSSSLTANGAVTLDSANFTNPAS